MTNEQTDWNILDVKHVTKIWCSNECTEWL